MHDALAGDLRMVLCYPGNEDPGLDLAMMDARRYLEERDPALVVTKPGASVRWITVRPLSVYDLAAVTTRPTHESKALAAVELGFVQIEGLAPDPTWTPAAPGAAWRPSHEADDALGRTRAVLSRAELDWLFHRLGWPELMEIGAVILERANAGNGAGGAVRYTAPQR